MQSTVICMMAAVRVRWSKGFCSPDYCALVLEWLKIKLSSGPHELWTGANSLIHSFRAGFKLVCLVAWLLFGRSFIGIATFEALSHLVAPKC